MKNLMTLVIGIFISTFCVNAQTFCDQPQYGPGFPSDPDCEAAICADDAFCCYTDWDALCATTAGEEPECQDCIEGATASMATGFVYIDYNCNEIFDGDDVAISGVVVSSDATSENATTESNGSFALSLSAETLHNISAVNVPGMLSSDEITINTPDISNTYDNLEIGICPDPNFAEVEVSILEGGGNVMMLYLLGGNSSEIALIVANNGLLPVDVNLQYSFDNSGLSITDADGGVIGAEQVDWSITDIQPNSEQALTVSLEALGSVEIGDIYNTSASVELQTGFPADAFPTNNAAALDVSISQEPSGPEGPCTQMQDGPGLPDFPECETVVCAADPFCCDTMWDAICAMAAENFPECQDCVNGQDYSSISGVVFVDYNCNGNLDGDDFGIPSVGILSSVEGDLAETNSAGEYSGSIAPLNLHDIISENLDGFNPPNAVSITTPETSAEYAAVNFGLCPMTDYYDVAVESEMEIDGNWTGYNELYAAQEFSVNICVKNNGPFTAAGDLSFTFDEGFFVIVDAAGGTVENGEISWAISDIAPLGQHCLEVEAVVAADIGVGAGTQFTSDFSLEGGLPADQNPSDNSTTTEVTIIQPAISGAYCDQAQSTPGFPANPSCEAAVCGMDAFCCSNVWDGLCASNAATLPECELCLWSTNTSVVSGKVYVDFNCDGIYNNDDVPAPDLPVLRNGSLMSESNVIGDYSGVIEVGVNTEIAVAPIAGYTTTTQNVYSDQIESIPNINIPICPDYDVTNLGVTLSPVGLPPRPGFPVEYEVCVTNYSTQNVDALLSFDYSDMPNISLIDGDGGTDSGNTLTWNLTGMSVFQVSCFEIIMEVAVGTDPGTVLNPVATVAVTPDPGSDIDLSNNEHSFSHEVVAAYDPNDKTVDQPVVNFTEIAEGEGAELEYLIRFQNTGNFFATNVRVEDELPELLDINSIEMIHASHDYEIVIHPNNKIEWVFENIMLPDSTTNEPESHGQIHFRINTVVDVQLEDVVENVASIFFDFKEPVITEPAITTFMDCSEGSLDVVGLEAVCAGEAINLSANRPDFESYIWTVNGEQLEGSEIELTAPETSTTIQLTASHQVCELSTTVTLNVIEVPEVEIESEDGLLVTDPSGESYSWYFEGELLEWATESWMVPGENGNYEVIVTYEGGCTGSDEILYQSVGIEDMSETDILLAPNPANGTTQLLLPKGKWQVSLMSVSGKVLNRFESVTVNRFDLELSSLAPGLYYVSIESEGERFVKKIVVE